VNEVDGEDEFRVVATATSEVKQLPKKRKSECIYPVLCDMLKLLDVDDHEENCSGNRCGGGRGRGNRKGRVKGGYCCLSPVSVFLLLLVTLACSFVCFKLIVLIRR